MIELICLWTLVIISCVVVVGVGPLLTIDAADGPGLAARIVRSAAAGGRGGGAARTVRATAAAAAVGPRGIGAVRRESLLN